MISQRHVKNNRKLGNAHVLYEKVITIFENSQWKKWVIFFLFPMSSLIIGVFDCVSNESVNQSTGQSTNKSNGQSMIISQSTKQSIIY